jgi:nickel/cobalt exporter
VSSATFALLAAAGGVGFGHAVLPDHWVPMAVLGRTRRYPLPRVARLSALAGVAHVIVSIALGGVIIAVGLQFRSTLQSAQNTIIGIVLIFTGVGFAMLELSGHDHRRDHAHHHHHDQDHVSAGGHRHRGCVEGKWRGLAAVMVPFGAAASPDLTILPVFLAASAAGASTAIGSLLIFAVVTISTIVGLTLLACFGGYQIQGEWLERWGNAFTAGVLVVIGMLVVTGTI